MAHEQKKNLDLASVKKRLEDYEQMLQYYTLMRTKKKMKDFEAKFKEWWEVVEEYFKELEKTQPQHRADEIILRYKLEAYQKNFLDFISSNTNPSNINVLSQDEETEVGPSGITQEEEMQTKEPHDLKSGAVPNEDIQTKKPQDLKGGGQVEKEPQKIQEQEQVETILAIKEEVSKIQPQEIEPQIELVEEEVRIAKTTCLNYRARSGYRTTSYYTG